MSHPQNAPEGFFFLSLLYLKEEDLESIEKIFGHPSKIFIPSLTPSINYYEKEMGEGIKRIIWFYTEKISQDKILELKKLSYDIENKTSLSSKRTINIDPGFMTMDQMFLTTFKWAPFRLYHSGGIYFDLQYLFYKQKFTSTPWCYPDYASEEKLLFFGEMRKILKNFT